MATEKKETKKTTETKAKTSRAKKTAPEVEEIVTASEPEEKIIPEEKPEDIQEPAPENIEKTVRVKTRLNVRAGASKEAKIIRQLENGKKVSVFEIKDGWARIGDGEWAMADYLK